MTAPQDPLPTSLHSVSSDAVENSTAARPAGVRDTPLAPRAGDVRPSTPTPGSLVAFAWQVGPAQLARLALRTPARVFSAGQAALRAAEQLPALVARMRMVTEAADRFVTDVAAVTARADRAVDRVDATRNDAQRLVAAIARTEDQVDTLLDRLRPLLDAAAEIDPDLVRGTESIVSSLQPILRRCAELAPDVPQQAEQLLERAGPLLDQFDTLLIPLLAAMRDAVPDVRDILPVVQRLEPVMVDVETRVAGLPGSARMRRRGEREIADAVADEDD